MSRTLDTFALVSVLLSGAIFGFFYAWVCSTMWGLDAADPRTAIAAMQAMNASVRNMVFAPAFFGTPAVLGLTALIALGTRARPAAILFGAGAILYTVGGLALTMVVNVPMNLALGELVVPADPAEAARIWADYSPRWQVFNQIRTAMSGLTLILAALGFRTLARRQG